MEEWSCYKGYQQFLQDPEQLRMLPLFDYICQEIKRKLEAKSRTLQDLPHLEKQKQLSK